MKKNASAKIIKKLKISPKFVIEITALIITILFFYFVYQAHRMGIFSDPEKMKTYLTNFGYLAPLVYVLFQFIQVVIPMIPGATSTGLGLIVFGVWPGLLLNILVVVPCMMLNFYLSKKYGWSLIYKFFGKKRRKTIKKWLKITPDRLNHLWIFKNSHKFMSNKTYDKMINWLSKKNGLYEIIISITMLLPGFPADLLCYAYGLTDIKYKKFLAIILITKPINMLMLGVIVKQAFAII